MNRESAVAYDLKKHTMAEQLPNEIAFGREICGDIAQAERREWWLSNGLGGYASGTIAGTLTRCYHGLLIAPIQPPLGRMLLAAKADATLIDTAGREWPLFTNRWSSGVVDPVGHQFLESFRLEGRMPVWKFRCSGHRLEMRIWLEPGAHTTCVAYRLEADILQPAEAMLKIRLLTNFRDHHGRTVPRSFDPSVEETSQGLRLVHPGETSLYIKTWKGSVRAEHAWVEGFDLPVERERGLPDRDSHFSPGEAFFTLRPGEWSGVIFSLDENAEPDLDASLQRFRSADVDVLAGAENYNPATKNAPEWIRQLTLAADSFLFARPLPGNPEGESIIAGYPWFGDWGRDTMIALPGLTLATGRHGAALHILETFARFIDQGMLPNVFPGIGDLPDFNTVDAALWYIEAWRAYVETTGDVDACRRAFPALKEIVHSYQKGTRYGIHMDLADGLIFAGEPGVQLTWMDAKVGDTVFTPRIGKPVEINALWHNALCTMAALAELLELPAPQYHLLAATARAGFQRFAREDGEGLLDVLDGPDSNDQSIRPNQILAVSLHYSPLEAEAQKSVVAVCQSHLLCTFGLRSLAPSHPDYRSHYLGGAWERDSAYHQGPVWGWLLGHYAVALQRVSGDTRQAQELLGGIRFHLHDVGLGTISEIFDGAPPHHPRGCPAQAWSVACTLEAWWKL